MSQSSDAFQAHVIRQLRTPLAGLSRFADLLQVDSSGEQRNYARLIKRISRHLLDTVDTVLFLGSGQEESVRSAAEAFDLAAECREALDRHQLQANEQGLSLKVDTPPSLPLVMEREVVRRILDNLISSSLRYTDKGGVTLAAGVEDGVVTLSIRNSGRGIPQEIFPHLAEVLVQPLPQSGEDMDRVGISLALANRLIRLVGGKLEISSTAGIGSIFTVRLPFADAASMASADKVEAADDATPARPRLLLLEDNDVTRRVLELMLGARYQVSAAAGYDEAMELAAFHTFDVLLLDIHLAERRTGVEVLHAIRRLRQYRAIPAVACTAYGLPGLRERFLEAGFNEYLAKPFKKQQLLDAVGAAMQTTAGGEDALPAEKVDIKLPPLPETLPKLLQLITAGPSGADVEGLAKILEHDPVITTWVLRHVNSAFYSVRGQVSTIDRAVTLLGFEPVCNLVLAEVLAHTFGGFESPRAQRVYDALLKQSLATAAFAREIASHLQLRDPELAFAAGMLHQLGRLGLLGSDPDAYAGLWIGDEEDALLSPPPRGQELLRFGTDHHSLGAEMAQKWDLPSELRSVIRHHADEPLAEKLENKALVMVVAVGRKAAQGIASQKDDAFLVDPRSQLLKDLAQLHGVRAADLAHLMAGKVESVRKFVEEVFHIGEDRT